MIRAYGLFWRADEVDWSPGSGNKGKFRLLGRLGDRRPGLRLADFRDQRGLYVLYREYGPHYVGLTRQVGMGQRLKDHRSDHHSGEWDRFSWFGFRRVLTSKDGEGVHPLAGLASQSIGEMSAVIGDMEALLISALGCDSNLNKMQFRRAERWTQVRRDEVGRYLERVAPKSRPRSPSTARP